MGPITRDIVSMLDQDNLGRLESTGCRTTERALCSEDMLQALCNALSTCVTSGVLRFTAPSPAGKFSIESTPSPPCITDPNSHDDIRNEMKEMKTQLHTILHALNIGSDHDSGQSSEGGNDHRRPEESTRPVLARATSSANENETRPVESNDILGIIAETQRQLAQALNQNSRPLQVHSSGDTAAAIHTFEGNQRESLKDWLEEIDRVASLTNWTPSLTMLNAITRLRGAARDWRKSHGNHIHDWDVWKHAIAERFKRKMSLQEFFDFQNERKLKPGETLVQY
ncbi:hypothetical protein HPB47_004087, partial [Ixodes persulcatus]